MKLHVGANIGHFHIKIIRHLSIHYLRRNHVGHLKFTSACPTWSGLIADTAVYIIQLTAGRGMPTCPVMFNVKCHPLKLFIFIQGPITHFIHLIKGFKVWGVWNCICWPCGNNCWFQVSRLYQRLLVLIKSLSRSGCWLSCGITDSESLWCDSSACSYVCSWWWVCNTTTPMCI